MKSNLALQDRLAKQNELGRRKLARELVKLEKVEKSDLRMIENERHRFRSRHKKLGFEERSPGSDAINVRMYETHNPGFCYHCTGAMKESGSSAKKQPCKDSYDFVHSILFTKGEVDPEKLLCLHLLTAHSTKWNNDEDDCNVRPITPLMEKGKEKHFTGAWNNVLPCYVVDTQRTSDDASLENIKLHEDPRKLSTDDRAIREFEEKYKRYAESNEDFGRALSTNAKQWRMAPNGLGKMPIISPHVYSLLGASHELRMKQALADGGARKRFARSSMDFSTLEEGSLSFRLDDDDDASRVTTNLSTRNWGDRSTRSPSKRSAFGPSFKLDRGFTMLKWKRSKMCNHPFRSRNNETPRDLVTIKSSFRAIKETPSKTSSTKSPFRNTFTGRSSTNSFLSCNLNSTWNFKKYRKCVYLNSPIRCMDLRDEDLKTVPILVNYQVQALVHSVLDVLERVSPEKFRKIIDMARNTKEINKMLVQPEMQNFVQSLVGQSLISSPESFVISLATVTDEVDFRFEGTLEKEIIALTLEMPLTPSLDALITEIRNNIFLNEKKKRRPNNTEDVPSTSDERKIKKRSAKKDEKPKVESNGQLNLHDGKLPYAEVKVNTSEYSKKSGSPTRRRSNVVHRDKFEERSISEKEKEPKKTKEKCDNLEQSSDKETLTDAICTLTDTSETIGKKKQTVKKSSKKNRIVQDAGTKSGLNVGKNSGQKSDRVSSPNEKRIVKNSQDSLSKDSSSIKTWKAAQDPGYLDADHVILRRMTNTQRILVGQMCASLKTKRINNEGLINERVPLAALIAPALSRDSIKYLTRGTTYSRTETLKEQQNNTEDNITVPDKLSGPVLAKIRQDVADNETKRRLKSFLEYKV